MKQKSLGFITLELIKAILYSVALNRIIFAVAFELAEYISDASYTILCVACPVLAVILCVLEERVRKKLGAR